MAEKNCVKSEDKKLRDALKRDKKKFAEKEVHKIIFTPTVDDYETTRKRDGHGYTAKHYVNIRAVEKIFSLMSNRDKRWMIDDPKALRFYDIKKTDFKNRFYGDVVYMHSLDKPAGFIDVWRRADYLEICMGVSKYYKHRGIATRMFKKFMLHIRNLKAKGKFDHTFKEIRWCCHEDNVKSYNCAIKLGFVDKGRYTKYNGKAMPFEDAASRIREIATHDLVFNNDEERDAFIKEKIDDLVAYNYLSYKL